MGNYKKNKTKLQMKFFALVALLGTAASMRLKHQQPPARQGCAHHQVHNMFAKKRAQKLIKAKWEDLSPEQEAEVEAWVTEQLTTGEGTITKEEAHDALVAFGEKHGFSPISEETWEQLEAMFDEVDTNGDGEIDLEELSALA